MLLWLVFGVWGSWPATPVAGQRANFVPFGGTLLMFVLFILIGIHDFGMPIHQ